MLDEAQDADPVILGLVERHAGARIIVGDKYQQLYQWRGAVNALSRMRSDSAELSLTQTFRFGAGAAAWANHVLEVIGEKLRIIPAAHRTTAGIEEKPVTIDALLARTNAGTLDEAIQGLERKRKVHVMGGADPLLKLILGAWDLHRGKPASGELVMFASWAELKAAAQGQKDGSPGDPALQVLVRLIKDRDRGVLQMCRQLEACVDLRPLLRSRSVPCTRPKAWNGRRYCCRQTSINSSNWRAASLLSISRRLTSCMWP